MYLLGSVAPLGVPSPAGDSVVLSSDVQSGVIAQDFEVADSLLRQVAPHRFARWVKLDAGQPTDLSSADLRRLLEWRAAP